MKQGTPSQQQLLFEINMERPREQQQGTIHDTTMTMKYVMIEEVIGNSNDNIEKVRSYRKYVAIVSSSRNSNDDDPMLTTPSTVDDATTYVTVSQWVQAVLSVNSSSSSRNTAAIQSLNEIIATCPYDAIFFETPPIISQNNDDADAVEQQRFEFVIVNAPELHEMTIATYNNKQQQQTQSTTTDNVNPFHKPLTAALSSRNPYAASFPNLGGDAILIVPQYIPTHNTENDDDTATTIVRELDPAARYAHLANFIRYHHCSSSSPSCNNNNEKSDQVAAVWKMVAQTYQEQIILLQQQQQHDSILSDKVHTRQGPRQASTGGLWLSTSGTGVLYLHFRIDSTPKYYSYEPYKMIL